MDGGWSTVGAISDIMLIKYMHGMNDLSLVTKNKFAHRTFVAWDEPCMDNQRLEITACH